MLWQQLFARKSLERLREEMKGENRLRRVLGPVALTALGVGAIIGSGIFVTTGETAATKAGPAVMLSYVVAGFGCLLAALCYAEFASMAPVAGSAYTYAYATLGELLAWIIGWDLVLEYAMSCGVVAADWTKYFNELLEVLFGKGGRVPAALSTDPFTIIDKATGATGMLNLPAVIVMALVTVVLVIGIRESATTNALLVAVKVGVVVFVVVVGYWYINPANWTGVPVQARRTITVSEFLERHPDVARLIPADKHRAFTDGEALFKYLEQHPEVAKLVTREELSDVRKLKSDEEKWGLISVLGLNRWLEPLDDRTRSPFLPYGLTGILVASAAVFFAYIGFDSISTHAEEAKKPQRDVPIGILASLAICTVLYLGVSAVITGMEPYPEIDEEAAVAVAFRRLAEKQASLTLRVSAGLIATGAVAGMTSVLLITLLSQARIFLAMARDGLLPPQVFGAVHHRFRTPHLSTMLTGGLLCVITAFTPISLLFNMVNIGTLLAFVIVCAAVLLLRITRPEAERPFRCPAVYVLAPLGIAVNLLMMLFLPLETWLRLVGWLLLGLVIYAGYGFRHTIMAREQWRQLPGHADLPDEDYYHSGEYRRRLRISLGFCAAVGLLAVATSAVAFILWRLEKLTDWATALTFSNPATLVWLALGATAFVTFLFVANLLEWQRARTTPEV
jgi:APA family basic amino acid/polyamine antiporter